MTSTEKLVFVFVFLLLVGVSNMDNEIAAVPTLELSPAQESMNIYTLKDPIVNSSLVSYWAEDMFNLTTDLGFNDGIYYVVDGNRTLEVEEDTGAMWFADYTQLWSVSYSPNLPALNTCRYIADDFLETHGIMPDDALFTEYGSTNASAYNPGTEERQTKLLGVQVNYGLELENLPVSGSTCRISVNIGNNGEVIGMNWAWREVEVYQAVEIVSFDTALTMAPIGDYASETHDLVYHWVSDYDHNFLQPVYEVTASGTIEGEEYQYVRHIPATTFSPAVIVNSPSPASTFYEGDAIGFNCTPLFGTAPYTYSWSSSIDGQLSSAQSFTTSTLSAANRSDSVLPHIVSVVLTDANGLQGEAIVLVTIQERPSIDITTIAIGAAVVLLLLIAIIVVGRRKGAFVLMLLLVFLIGFLLLPSASAGIPEKQASMTEDHFIPSQASDDGTKEVGIEWLTYPYEVTVTIFGMTFTFTVDDLPSSDDLAIRFYNKIGSYGWTKSFSWGNEWAWEEDFKYETLGGTDHIWIDTVDIALFSGHGGPTGFLFNTNHDDTWLSNTEARWGDGDLEWIILDACECLKDTSGGQFAEQRWGPALRGVHMICGFETTASDVKSRGEKFAEYMRGISFSFLGIDFEFPGMTVMDAWFKACKKTEGSGTWAAVVYSTRAANPWSPPLDDPSNDHLHGEGYVCSDPYPCTWWVWIAQQC